jgi:hypothetical protein
MGKVAFEQFEELARDLEIGSPGARERIEVLVLASNAFSAAAASLVMADYKERRGLFTETLRAANSGITRLASARAKGKDADRLRAGLMVERGIAYAGLGRVDDALATHDELAAAHPTYDKLALGKFRICFLAATRVGEFADALQICQMRSDALKIDERDLFVGEVLAAVLDDAPQAERERLLHKVRDEDALARWLRAAAPGLEARLIEPEHVRMVSGEAPTGDRASDPDVAAVK